MARANSSAGTVAKSALLWLTLGAVFASVFGALISTQSEAPSLMAPDTSRPVLAVNEDAGHAN